MSACQWTDPWCPGPAELPVPGSKADTERLELEAWVETDVASTGIDGGSAWPLRTTPLFPGSCGACLGRGLIGYMQIIGGRHPTEAITCPICGGAGRTPAPCTNADPKCDHSPRTEDGMCVHGGC